MSTHAPVITQVTFDGLRAEQLESRWIERVGGIEAYVFDGRQLAGEQPWRRLRANLRRARDLGADPLTMHFPTDNADWVHDPDAYAALLRFCELAAEVQADGVVLHSNQFVPVDGWPAFDLAQARKRVVAKLGELDERLTGSPMWIGVENMPIIGSAGLDFDSVFVRPADFDALLELDSPCIGVTWDVCHWAVSYSTLRAIAHLRQEEADVHPLDLPAPPVRHIHFASFAGHAMPYWPADCFEGAIPQAGWFDQDLLAAMLAEAIGRAAPGCSVVFEVQEDDYRDRRNCWETLAWAAEHPALAGLVRTERPA
ncbi:MAG TPA: TIM barrel protein [Actinophytocola sp.]|uniref:sugar phosphate isomerase/epimerase family protein n=1 Tax=Actinophytocola sp. TaxID=1872138 RepID=UPI002DFABC77|nr:TIM barrel protein [Actinophytocola sp.]